MKIYIPNYDSNRLGGGWTFCKNFSVALGEIFTQSYEESTHYFIAGASMVERSQAEEAKRNGKKIILRVDNAPRNSRNRGTGMTRMKDFSVLSDLVVYQSEWARWFLLPFLKVDGPVILNGVDTSIFNPDKRIADNDTYLYIRSSRDEGKQWIMAWYWFVNNPGFLEIVGKFSPENIDYNFDFFNNERYRYLGEQSNMADIYRRNKHFLYTYLNDACSNTLIEAKASGCKIVDVFGMLSTGGAPEIMACQDLSSQRMVKQYMEAIDGA